MGVIGATCVPVFLVYRGRMIGKAWGASVCGVLASVVVGCGGGSPTSNAPAKASAACVEFESVSAARSARCNGGSAADWAAYEANYETCPAYDQHVRDGQVQYRRDMFAACLAEYDRPCEETISNCRYDVLHGLVADGQHCQDTEVCGTNSACFNLGTNTCGEVCARFAVQGEACGIHCGSGPPCLDAPICDPSAACVSGVCVKPKAVGDACGPADPVPCGRPAYCSADAADPLGRGTCVAIVAGGPCRADAECPLTEFCLQGTCTARRAIGQSCADAPTSCESWTICASDGHCAVAGKPDFPCAPYPGQPDALVCTTGTCVNNTLCVANGHAGDSCLMAFCAPGTSCDLSTTTCVACGL
jgi:hypothetical protein